MSCEAHREQLIGALEGALAPEEIGGSTAHLEECEACRSAMEQVRALRARLVASADALAAPGIEERVMARIPPDRKATPRAGSRLDDLLAAARGHRLALGTAGLVVAVGVVAAALLHEPRPAWSIEHSIEAMKPYRAVHLRGTYGGNARCELWVRSSADHLRSERLLIRIDGGPIIWTEGNATHYYDPGSRVVYTDDAHTAGFNPWPGPKLAEMAQAAGVRMVETHRRFPAGRSVVVEWSLMTNRGPTSARAEFDLDTKLLVGLAQWDNMDRRGAPGFEAHDIRYAPDLPEDAFRVALPAGVVYRQKNVEVPDAVVGALALSDAGIPADGLALGEAGRRVVEAMWEAVVTRDLEDFKRLCPITRGWSDDFLKVILGDAADPEAVAEVIEVSPGVPRGHSRLGPVSVVTSRVRHGDGRLYEEKTIVQHRMGDPVPSCVVYSNYGQPYPLE